MEIRNTYLVRTWYVLTLVRTKYVFASLNTPFGTYLVRIGFSKYVLRILIAYLFPVLNKKPACGVRVSLGSSPFLERPSWSVARSGK